MITSWMETLEELTAKYSSENTWKMDKSGCFFKALSDKGFVEKSNQARGGKNSEQKFTIAFLLTLPGKRTSCYMEELNVTLF